VARERAGMVTVFAVDMPVSGMKRAWTVIGTWFWLSSR
jgi:hypothetical protein